MDRVHFITDFAREESLSHHIFTNDINTKGDVNVISRSVFESVYFATSSVQRSALITRPLTRAYKKHNYTLIGVFTCLYILLSFFCFFFLMFRHSKPNMRATPRVVTFLISKMRIFYESKNTD